MDKMENRMRGAENTLVLHGRRHDDHDNNISTITRRIEEISAWRDSIKESTEVNRKMVEVGENLLQALSWIGTASKWVIAVGGALVAVLAGIKWMLAKLAL